MKQWSSEAVKHVNRSKSSLERFLGLFAEVRLGEGGTVILLALNVFLILASYYIMKPVREALILATGGAQLKGYMPVGQTLLLLFTVPLYAKLASRMPRRRLLNVVTVFYVACVGLFYLLAQAKVPLGIAFYLWIGIFNVSVVAQFWSFANDLYRPEQGKRLFAIVAFGASFGAVAGPAIAELLIDYVGHYQLLLIAGAVLGLSLVITNYVDSREKHRERGDGERRVEALRVDEAEKPIGKEGAYRLVLRNRYLLHIALLILFLNWVNTTGEYILARVVDRTLNEAVEMDPSLSFENLVVKFYAGFYKIVNIVGLLVQLFLVSRILKYVGVRVALLVLPLIAFGGYILAAFYPILRIIRWVKTAENATDYSLQNTLRGVLFLPTTREEKYKAKQAIDTLFVRVGDVLSAGLVLLGSGSWLTFETEHFAIVNLGLVIVWIVLAALIGRSFNRLTEREVES